MTDDDQMLMVGGGDGSIFTVNVNAEGAKCAAEWAAEGKLTEDGLTLDERIQATQQPMDQTDSDLWELPPGDGTTAVVDVTDPDHFSIQEAKLRSEEENAKAAAERQKRRVRERVRELRRELEEHQKKNPSLVNPLTVAELTVDPEYIRHLNSEMETKVSEVSHELAWSVEYCELGVLKMRERFLSGLDFERVEINGFAGPYRVSTFRCAAMSPDLQENLARLHVLIFNAEEESDSEGSEDDERGGGRERRSLNKGSSGKPGRASVTTDSVADQSKQASANMGAESAGASGAGGAEKQMTSAAQRELRRQLRTQRRQQIQELERAKPSDSHEDPQDVEAIAAAESTMGNYMLKTSEDYQVPENQRMNAEKKRRQMFLLEESMHAIKTEFNQRVLALRDFRMQVKEEVQRDVLALQEIDAQLGEDTKWVREIFQEQDPKVDFPERRLEYTEADLKAFKRTLLQREAGGAAAPQGPTTDEGDSDEEEGSDDEDGATPTKRRKGKPGEKRLVTTPAAVRRSSSAQRRVDRLVLRADVVKSKLVRFPLPPLCRGCTILIVGALLLIAVPFVGS